MGAPLAQQSKRLAEPHGGFRLGPRPVQTRNPIMMSLLQGYCALERSFLSLQRNLWHSYADTQELEDEGPNTRAAES